MISVSWDGAQVAGLVGDLSEAPLRAQMLARTVVTKSGMDLWRQGVINAPVVKGDLRNSIGLDLVDGGYTAVVGPTVHYGRHVEYGTRHMQPRRYLGRALDTVTPTFVAAMETIGGQAL